MNRPYKKIPVALFGYALCVSQFVAGCDDAEPTAGEGGVGGGAYATGTTGTVPGAVAGATGRYATGTKAGVGGSTGKVVVGGTGGKASTATTGKLTGTGGAKPTSSTKPTSGGAGNTGGASSKGGSGGKSSTGGTSAKGGSSSSGNPSGATIPRIPSGQGANGTTTRYWDCCKPACGWAENARANGKNPTKTCGRDGTSVTGAGTQSACSGGGAYQCYSFAPWSVSDTLSYGFAARSSSAGYGNCGKCFQLDFSNGKTLVVQVVNTGSDVSQDQFDLLIPGGGVGQFDACTNQWDAANGKIDLGAQYGGWLQSCGPSCVQSKCQAAFANKPDLLAGCTWFTTWFGTANNPKMVYKEITCPSEITARSGM